MQLFLFLMLSALLVCGLFIDKFGSSCPVEWRPAIEHMHGLLNPYTCWNAAIAIVLIVGFCLLVGYRRNTGKDLLKVFAVPMVIIWILGFITYTWIHSTSSQEFTLTENILKSIVDSFKLFLFEYNGDSFANMDFSGAEPFFYDAMAKAIVMILCILASLCTSVLIISLFANRLSAYLRLKFHHVYAKNNHLFIFWGISESAILLAHSIKESYKTGKKKPFIIFVDNPSNENSSEGNLLESIQEIYAPSSNLLTGNEDLGDYCVSEYRLSSVDRQLLKNDDVLSFVNLRVIKRRIRALGRRADSELHIFFLGDGENENICSAGLLKSDSTIISASKKGLKTKIYCHARHDSVNRAFEDDVLMRNMENMEIKVIDSSYLSIEQLKRTKEWHPVNFVDISTKNPGTVTSTFTSLVVGFGQTGRDAVRFLYEFGAFVDSESTDDSVRRSPFECHVVDSKMKDIEGGFIASVPNIRIQSSSPSWGDRFAANNIFLHNCNYGDNAFYRKVLSKIASKLNYVVLAAGDDETNITVAVNIMEYVRAHGNDLSKFHIFVRSYKKGNFDHLEAVVKHYNDSMGRTEGNPVISIFGIPEDIYNYEFIVRDRHLEEAKAFYRKYNDTICESSILLSLGTWDEREKIVLGEKNWQLHVSSNVANDRLVLDKINEAVEAGKNVSEGIIAPNLSVQPMGAEEKKAKVYTVLADRIQKLRRQVSQDMSNSLHRFSKIRFIDNALYHYNLCWGDTKVTTGDLAEMTCTGEVGNIKYVWNPGRFKPRTQEFANTLLLNLARLEHIRWNAAHEILGYVPAPKGQSKCIERNKTHNCLVTWEMLDKASIAAISSWPENVFPSEDFKKIGPVKDTYTVSLRYSPDYKKYDFNVVMTSLKLHVEEQDNHV